MSESHGEGYACGHCGKQFARRKHLTSHIARIRKSKKKTTSHIYFEHSMTMPAASNPDEQELEVVLSSSSSSSEDEESKEAPLAEGDEWNIELFERPAKRQKLEICDVKLMPPSAEQEEELLVVPDLAD